MELALSTARAKKRCAERGYIEDPYVSHFVADRGTGDPSMTRGYYARIRAIELTFPFGPRLVLGAGFDTSFWRCGGKAVEVDAPDVIRAKREIAKRNSLRVDGLDFVEADLNSFVPESSQPLIIAECVFAYLRNDNILDWASRQENVLVVIFEPLKSNDKFGKIMFENFGIRGWNLRTKTMDEWAVLPFQKVKALSMKTVCDRLLVGEEGARIRGLEPFDDPSEFDLLMSHYGLVLAANGTAVPFLDTLPFLLDD
ncbi:hypothetical protein CTAYLR_003104 [Chrysophaeum taylorii]|uniref:Leucine carboxyl methyltransferase 1 n=1 Tax=Chrysophaeum taylorii TaxID=2483200 RepID=A0AAD7XHU1_9STRA|nr:hypothetical protein CTAYLR_003104 [Chrysophaeum taylorii]